MLESITRFPPDAVAFKVAISLAIGMLAGFERESASKDAGVRTFALTRPPRDCLRIDFPRLWFDGDDRGDRNDHASQHTQPSRQSCSGNYDVRRVTGHVCSGRARRTGSHLHSGGIGYPDDLVAFVEDGVTEVRGWSHHHRTAQRCPARPHWSRHLPDSA